MSGRLSKAGREVVWAIAILIVGFCIIAILIGNFLGFLEVPFWLGTGWLAHLVRVIPKMTVSWPGLGMAVVTLGAFAVGLHFFASRVVEAFWSRPWRMQWTALLTGMVVILFIAGIGCVGVAHQVGWLITQEESWFDDGGFSQVARRSFSRNNLKQIGLAQHNYHDDFDHFVLGGTFDATGRALHSWEAQLLPYIDQQALFEQIDSSLPWTSSENRGVFHTAIPVFLNPGVRPSSSKPESDRTADGFAQSHYAANVRLFGPNRSLALREIVDGAKYTIMVGEIVARLPAWGDPVNWRDPAAGINKSSSGFGGPWTGGAQFLLCDGRAQFISDQIDTTVLEALATPAGNEDLSKLMKW